MQTYHHCYGLHLLHGLLTNDPFSDLYGLSKGIKHLLPGMGIQDRGGEFSEKINALLEGANQFLAGLFKGGDISEYLFLYISAQGFPPKNPASLDEKQGRFRSPPCRPLL
jgi:hypothetical protein